MKLAVIGIFLYLIQGLTCNSPFPADNLNETQRDNARCLNCTAKGKDSHENDTSPVREHSHHLLHELKHAPQEFVEGVGEAVVMPIESAKEVIADPEHFAKNTKYALTHGRELGHELKEKTKKAFKEHPAKAIGTALGLAATAGIEDIVSVGSNFQKLEASAATTIAEANLLTESLSIVVETIDQAEKVNELSSELEDNRYISKIRSLRIKALSVKLEIIRLKESMEKEGGSSPDVMTKLEYYIQKDKKISKELTRIETILNNEKSEKKH